MCVPQPALIILLYTLLTLSDVSISFLFNIVLTLFACVIFTEWYNALATLAIMIDDILKSVSDTPWYHVLAAASVLASAICALTPTPKEGSRMATFYKVIEFIALNIGKAKAAGAADKLSK